MITSFLLNVLYSFLSFIIGLLPAGGSVPAQWVASVNTIYGYIQAFSFIVPVTILMYCLGIALAFHLSIFGFKVFSWVLKKIPFVN